MKQPIQPLTINTERDDRSTIGSAGHSPYDAQSDCIMSPETPDENIDFNLVYALFAFEASVEGQANVIQGESLMLLDDSNSYWWLIRVLRDNSVGYLPAENIETPYERLARLNRHRNQKLVTLDSDLIEANSSRLALRPPNNKNVSFQTPFMPEILGDSDDDYYTDDEDDDSSREDSPRNTTVTSDVNSSFYHLDQVQKLSSVDISMSSNPEAVEILTVHTGNIDLSASWKPVTTSNQTVILDMIEEALEMFSLEECTSSNYYVVVYDSEEQAVYRLDDYDDPTEVIECIHEGTFQVPTKNRIQDTLYMYLSSHLTTTASLPNATNSTSRAHPLTFYLNRKLRTVRKDEDIVLRFPIQMIALQESGQSQNRMCIIKAKPSTMVVDFLRLALSELDISVDEATQLSSEYQVSLSTSDFERPLPFDSTLTTVFQVILGSDVDHDNEDILFVVRKNFSPKVSPLSLIGENIVTSQTLIDYKQHTVPVIEETYDSDSEEVESFMEDLEAVNGSKLSVHQMSIRLSIVENDKDDISEVLDDVINDYNDNEEEGDDGDDEPSAQTEKPTSSHSKEDNSTVPQHPGTNENASPHPRPNELAEIISEHVDITPESTKMQTSMITGAEEPTKEVVTRRMGSHEDIRPTSMEIKTRAIVSSVLRRIAPPPNSPPPPNLIARRKNSSPQIPINDANKAAVQEDTDEQIIADLIINTQLIKTVCSEEMAEDVPLADLHGHQIMDKHSYFTSSESLIEAVGLATQEEVTKNPPVDQPMEKQNAILDISPRADNSQPQNEQHADGGAALAQAADTKSSNITVEIVHDSKPRQSSGDSPIAYLEEYLGTMRSQSVRRKNKDDKKVVKLEEILGRTAPSRLVAGKAAESDSMQNNSTQQTPASSSQNTQSLVPAPSQPTNNHKELRQSPDAPRPDSASSNAEGSVATDSSGLNSQACKLLPLYNIQQTNDSGVALFYNDDEINNLILLVRGAVRFDYDHGEADGSLDPREFDQGESINQEVRNIFASTEEHLREIEQELDQVMTAIVNVF